MQKPAMILAVNWQARPSSRYFFLKINYLVASYDPMYAAPKKVALNTEAERPL